jgi:hypothetical protein
MAKGTVQALAPHWLDNVIADHRRVDGIERAICASSAFRSLLEKAIERGQQAEEAEQEGKLGANYTQMVRATICRGMAQNTLDLDAV